ncbi:signal transduction histidine kinase [Acidovorax sp. 62]|uniref:CHASE domain-containing protein n=1 Tax=Acidovorax sp. 62 TaxID=2035203 RepID=UPI000C18C361|nr:CHASE domain-containing protein [Acidovorax sp. 62]PIF89704.1 signal transduction histidine kinase [Acidovorax sp. 62]
MNANLPATDEHAELLKQYRRWKSLDWRPSLVLVIAGYSVFYGLGLVLSAGLAPTGHCLLPAVGFALAAVMVLGRKALAGIWLGHWGGLLLSWGLLGGESPWPSGITDASFVTLQAWAGHALLHRSLVWPAMLREPGQVFRLVGLGAVSALVHPTLSAAQQWMAGPSAWRSAMWAAYGDQALAGAMAIVLISPALIFWSLSGAHYRTRKFGLSAIVIAGMAVSMAAGQLVLSAEVELVRQRLSESNERIHHALQNDLRSHEEALHALAAAIANSPGVESADFARLTKPLLALAENLYALSWNPVIHAHERAGFETYLGQQAERQPATITERNAEGALVQAAYRNVHVAVQAIEPRAQNQAALGFDIYSDAVRRQAIEDALRTRRTSVTQRIRLVQDNTASWALLALDPVLQHHGVQPDGTSWQGIKGFATAVIQMESLIQAVVQPQKFRPTHDAAAAEIALQAYRFTDLSAPEAAQVLWSSDWPADTTEQTATSGWLAPLATPKLPNPSVYQFAFMGNRYQLQAQPLATFWTHSLSGQPHLVFSVCLLLTSVLSVLFLLTSGQQDQLRHEVLERTIELEQSQMVLQDAMQHYRQNLEQLTAIIDQTPVGYMAFDAQDQWVLANKASERLLGGSWAEQRPALSAVLQHMEARLSMTGLGDFSFSQWISQELAHHNPSCRLHRAKLQSEDGLSRSVDIEFIHYEHGPIRKVMLLVDVTQDEQLEHSKSQFIASAAHEIRTPLTSILGYSELLLARPDTAPALRHDMLSQITQHSRQIQELITKLLSVAELELNGAACLKRVDTEMLDWAQQVCASFKVPVHRMPPTWSAQVPAVNGTVDRRKLQRAVHELLSNAYLFSPPDSEVRVELLKGQLKSGAAAVELRVSNEGAGMTEPQLARAKERFYRVDQSGEHPGFGLGLTLADMIVGLHHGELRLQSQPGQGLTASLLIPL